MRVNTLGENLSMLVKRDDLESDITLLTVSGRMTLDRSLQEFESFFKRLVDMGSRKIVLDLSSVDYMDSSGIGTLVQASSVANAKGGALHVAGIRGMVDDVLRTTRVKSILNCFLSVELAVAAFNKDKAAAGS
jgi:anti-sigma B factor antagonist